MMGEDTAAMKEAGADLVSTKETVIMKEVVIPTDIKAGLTEDRPDH
jgi:hypothetical protein